MPVDVQWGDTDHTYLLYTFTGSWTWQELGQAEMQAQQITGKVDHVIHSVVDLRNSKMVPANALSGASTLDRNRPVYRGLTIVVGANNLVKVLVELLGRVGSRITSRIVMAKTIEEALDVVKSQPLVRLDHTDDGG